MKDTVNWITIPGLSPYGETISEMENKVQEIIAGSSLETIYLVEHEEVYTAGSGYSGTTNVTPLIHTGRGGKLTYHGKGQRVIYPVINLNLPNRKKDLALYVRMLEAWIINSLQEIGIKAYTINDKVGIWVRKGDQDAKIASIGIRVKKWVAYHGIAINISTDLSKFNAIIACGIENVILTSLLDLGITITMEEFDALLKKQFYRVFK